MPYGTKFCVCLCGIKDGSAGRVNGSTISEYLPRWLAQSSWQDYNDNIIQGEDGAKWVLKEMDDEDEMCRDVDRTAEILSVWKSLSLYLFNTSLASILVDRVNIPKYTRHTFICHSAFVSPRCRRAGEDTGGGRLPYAPRKTTYATVGIRTTTGRQQKHIVALSSTIQHH